jgi:hypothetical protein
LKEILGLNLDLKYLPVIVITNSARDYQIFSTNFACTSKTIPSHLIARANNTRVLVCHLTPPFSNLNPADPFSNLNPADSMDSEYHSHQMPSATSATRSIGGVEPNSIRSLQYLCKSKLRHLFKLFLAKKRSVYISSNYSLPVFLIP